MQVLAKERKDCDELKRDFNTISRRSKNYESRSRELEAENITLKSMIYKDKKSKEVQTDIDNRAQSIDLGIVGKVSFWWKLFYNSNNNFYFNYL